MQNFLTFRTVLSCPSVAIFTFTITTSSSRPLLPMTVVRCVIKNWRAGKSLHLTSVSHNQKQWESCYFRDSNLTWECKKNVFSKQIPFSSVEVRFGLFLFRWQSRATSSILQNTYKISINNLYQHIYMLRIIH